MSKQKPLLRSPTSNALEESDIDIQRLAELRQIDRANELTILSVTNNPVKQNVLRRLVLSKPDGYLLK